MPRLRPRGSGIEMVQSIHGSRGGLNMGDGIMQTPRSLARGVDNAKHALDF